MILNIESSELLLFYILLQMGNTVPGCDNVWADDEV
jgi:hypothetical protein